MRLTRDEERRLEVWAMLRPYEPLDFEQAAWADHRAKLDARRAEYREMQRLDHGGYQRLLAKLAERRAQQPGYYAKRLMPADAREMRRMYAAGAPVKAIAAAFGCTKCTVQCVLRGESHAAAGGYVHEDARKRGDCVRRATGAANGRASLTPEVVASVVAANGTMRAVGRQLGLHHSMVSAIRAGKTWLQRAQAQAAE
jgi:hypothetical protein